MTTVPVGSLYTPAALMAQSKSEPFVLLKRGAPTEGRPLLIAMNQFKIRFATRDDIPQLARFRLALRSKPGSNEESDDDFLERCETWMSNALNQPQWRCWVVDNDGVLTGAIWLQVIEKIPNPTSENERLAYITNFFVAESARSQGLGTRIMFEVLNWCREESVHSVILWPTDRSRPLYERYGFAVPQGLFELKLTI